MHGTSMWCLLWLSVIVHYIINPRHVGGHGYSSRLFVYSESAHLAAIALRLQYG